MGSKYPVMKPAEIISILNTDHRPETDGHLLLPQNGAGAMGQDKGITNRLRRDETH